MSECVRRGGNCGRCVGCEEADANVSRCCLPDCGAPIPQAREIQVCRSCRVKIALDSLANQDCWELFLVQWQRHRGVVREEFRARNERTSVVYYVDLGDCVKIGYTTNIRTRLSGLRVDPHQLLALEPGGRELEEQRHQQFRSSRIGRRENFARTPILEAHIAMTLEEHGLPDWAKVPDTRVKIRQTR